MYGGYLLCPLYPLLMKVINYAEIIIPIHKIVN